MRIAYDEIQPWVETIIASAEFPGGERMSALLRYLVKEECGNPGQKIKAYAIGIDVMERRQDFDPAFDAIVRVQVGRLRQVLKLYSATAGKYDKILISIPSGGYNPVFERNPLADPAQSEASGEGSPDAPKGTPDPGPGTRISPTAITILPFKVHGGDERAQTLSLELASNIGVSLSGAAYLEITDPPDVSVLGAGSAARTAFGITKARFVLGGSIYLNDGNLRVTAQVIDCVNDFRVIWSHAYHRKLENIAEVIDDLADCIQFETRMIIINVLRARIAAKNVPLNDAATIMTMALPLPSGGINSLDDELALETAARNFLETRSSATVMAVLGGQLSYIACFSPPHDTAVRRSEAERYVAMALNLEPANPEVIFLALLQKLDSGQLSEIERLSGRIIEADPGHMGARLLRKVQAMIEGRADDAILAELDYIDQRLATNSPLRWVVLNLKAQSHFSKGNFEQALREAIRTDEHFWTPTTSFRLAACHLMTGAPDAAIAELRRCQLLWPTMSPRHYATVVAPRLYGEGFNSSPVSGPINRLADLWDAHKPA